MTKVWSSGSAEALSSLGRRNWNLALPSILSCLQGWRWLRALMFLSLPRAFFAYWAIKGIPCLSNSSVRFLTSWPLRPSSHLMGSHLGFVCWWNRDLNTSNESFWAKSMTFIPSAVAKDIRVCTPHLAPESGSITNTSHAGWKEIAVATGCFSNQMVNSSRCFTATNGNQWCSIRTAAMRRKRDIDTLISQMDPALFQIQGTWLTVIPMEQGKSRVKTQQPFEILVGWLRTGFTE